MPDNKLRTQDEIVERLIEAKADANDIFGWRLEVLFEAATHESICRAFPDRFESGTRHEPVENIEDAANGYLGFAVEKIINHRGISASRSVIKLREYAWLLGRDDVVAAMSAEPYPQYGAPMVKAFAEGMGWDWPEQPPGGLDEDEDKVTLYWMARGVSCRDGCSSGCGAR